MDSTKYFQELGIKLACHDMGADPEEVMAARGFMEALDADPEGKFHKIAASCAAMLYAAAGECESLGHMLYVKVASSPWRPGHALLMKPLYEALGNQRIEKRAGIFKKMIGSAMSWGPETWRTAALLSALTGGAAGTLNWKLNRDIAGDDDEVNTANAKVDEYKRVTDEINNNLAVHGFTPR